jgi:hypothetical protein
MDAPPRWSPFGFFSDLKGIIAAIVIVEQHLRPISLAEPKMKESVSKG